MLSTATTSSFIGDEDEAMRVNQMMMSSFSQWRDGDRRSVAISELYIGNLKRGISTRLRLGSPFTQEVQELLSSPVFYNSTCRTAAMDLPNLQHLQH